MLAFDSPVSGTIHFADGFGIRKIDMTKSYININCPNSVLGSGKFGREQKVANKHVTSFRSRSS